MSSSHSHGSLSGLAAAALEVERLLEQGSEMNPETWDHLRNQINQLQVDCPNHRGVHRARVIWYELALDSFEKIVVMRAETGHSLTGQEWVSAFWNPDGTCPGLLADHYMLEPFLRRHYLKDDFPRLYTRMMSLYERLLALSHLNEKVRSRVNNLVGERREMLLEGRH